MKIPNVLVVQRIVPHYRVPFFQELCASDKMHTTIAYGQEPSGSSLKSVMNAQGLTIVPIRNIFYGKNSLFIIQKGLIPLLRQGRFDAVIAEFDIHIFSNILACLRAKRNHAKFIWWGQGIGPRGRTLSKILRMWLIRNADAVIFYDKERADRFVQWGVPREKVFVAWNSIDTDEMFAYAERWTDSHRNRILYIGRLIPKKKVDLLIRGFAMARPNLPDGVRLTIIGDGPEFSGLMRLARESGLLEWIDFTGELHDQERLSSYFNSSLVSVSPGPIGLSAIHSLAYGLPILVADKEAHGPEISALEEGKNGSSFSAGSATSLSDSLVALLSDTELLARMSSEARKAIQMKFNLRYMVESFEAAVAYACGK